MNNRSTVDHFSHTINLTATHKSAQKRVYHRTRPSQEYTTNSNSNIELPLVQPINLTEHKSTETNPDYHQSDIRHLLLDIDHEKGWTEQDVGFRND